MIKKIRPLIVCCVIWIVAAVIINTAILVSETGNRQPYTTKNSYAENSEAIFVTENIRTAGLVYRLNSRGEVETLFSTKDFPTLSGWKAVFVEATDSDEYVLFTRVHDDGGRVINQYTVAMMNDGLQVTYLMPIFRFPMELNLTGFKAVEDGLYLTAVSDNGQQAYTYMVEPADMMSISNSNLDQKQTEEFVSGDVKVEEIALQESVKPRFIVEADYDGENMLVRYDNSSPDQFAMDSSIATLFDGRRMTMGQKVKATNINLTYLVLLTFLGVFVLVILFIIFFERLRIVYAMASWELFLGVLLLIIYFGVVSTTQDSAESQYRRYELSALYNAFDGYPSVALSDSTLYSGDPYQVISERLRRRTEKGGMANGARDILIVENSSNLVRISASGKNMDPLYTIYTREVLSMLDGAEDGVANLSMEFQGEKLSILAADLARAGYDGYSGYVIRSEDSVLKGVMADNTTTFRWFFALFVIGSIVGALFLFLQGQDIRQLRSALATLAKGETGLQKPSVVGRDLSYMWNSVFEIEKNFDLVNRMQFVRYEAYYRFAPKSVERILGKESITEVKPNDAVCLNGALAIFSTEGQKTLDTRVIENVDMLLDAVESFRNEYDGILLSGNSSLTEMKFYFPENEHNVIGFGTDLMLDLKEQRDAFMGKSALIAHYCPFRYGVAGTSEQNSIYLSSPEVSALTEYLPWFRDLNLGFVVTETLLEKEKPSVDTRCIGFIFPDKRDREKRLKLYEVLDAKPASARSMRIRTKKRFAEALELFYKQDFYFARSSFTEILRESPDDLLSKWYVFECEYYLNDAAPGDFAGELHTESKES